MSRRRSAPHPRKTTRRWHIPPALVHGPEPLEGGAVLEELRSPLGALLWQAVRDVMLWADATDVERGDLFAPRAGIRRRETLARSDAAEALRPPLAVLAELVAAPGAASAAVISEACVDVAAWAEHADHLQTALAFAQSAALANPLDSHSAFYVARIAARLADHARAEVWFRRAIGLARQTRDWRMYSRAFSGLGNLYLTRGNLPAAQRFHMRALRGARRGGLRAEQAAALHDLFGVAIETGRSADAERFARDAAAAYGSRNPRYAVLAHDVAYFWMQRGHFGRALAVFEAVLPLIDHPVERLFVEADLMRAAAGTGDHHLAREVAERVWEKVGRPECAAGAARALLELGRGALQLGDLDLALRAGTGAVRAAETRKEGKTLMAAEALLEAIRTAGAASRLPATAMAPVSPISESLAGDLVRTLRDMSRGSSPAPRA